MVAYNDLTDRRAVELAIEECDRLGRSTFLEKYGYGEAREYFLVTATGRYDSKAIFAAAYEFQHGVAVASSEISGGKHAAAKRLVELGYVVEGINGPPPHDRPVGVEPAAVTPALPGRGSIPANRARLAATEVCPECWIEMPSTGECPNH